MKILHFSRSLSRSAGGLYYSVSGLTKALLALGADVGVVGGSDGYFPNDRQEWGNVPLFPFRLGRSSYGLSQQAIAEIYRQKPDIVHVQGIWSSTSIYGRISGSKDIPVVVSPRGMLDPWILARRPAVKAVHSTLFERPMLNKGFLHALNQSEREAALEFMPDLEGRVFVVPNGINRSDIPSAGADRSGALFLGRLHSKKQVVELIRAWSSSPTFAHERLTIAGWGDAGYEAEVAALARAAPNVDFVGSLYGKDKEDALTKARYFILPSLSEGLPMAVLEALQFGCIPVITEQCNLPELFADKIAIRIATDFHDFDSVMDRLLSLPEEESRAMSDRAAAYASRYLWSNIAAQMADQYEHILSAGRPASAG